MLAIIQVGHSDASDRYIRSKMKAVKKAGMKARVFNLPEACATDDIIDIIGQLAWGEYPDFEDDCSAIIVQLPLPEHINKEEVFRSIPIGMDIDGLNPRSDYQPLTPCAIMRYFKENDIDLSDKCVAVIGRSELVGLPLTKMLIGKANSVISINSTTNNYAKSEHLRRANIIIAAAGNPEAVTANDVVGGEKGKIVIDVGINRTDDGKLHGDVTDGARVYVEATGGYCSPVPGGVGKWTVRELVLRLKEMEESYEL